jgi:DNA-binding CsgD family transcriptional regulator
MQSSSQQCERIVIGLHVGRVDAAVVGCVPTGRARGPDAVSEVERVHRRRVDGGAVPDSFAGDHVADPHGFEGAAQLEDDLQRVHRVDRQRRLRPQPVDEHGGRDGAAGAEEQLGEQGTRRLLAAVNKTADAAPVQPGLIEPLSDRELDVLRLLGTDLNGPDIARELTVSLSTVRTHTNRIYAKLGVNNRRAAVRQAQQLDLMPRTRDR